MGAIVGGILTLAGTLFVETIKSRSTDERTKAQVLRRLPRNIRAVQGALLAIAGPDIPQPVFGNIQLEILAGLLNGYREYQDDVAVLDATLVTHIDKYFDRLEYLVWGSYRHAVGANLPFVIEMRHLPMQTRISIMRRSISVGVRLLEILGAERSKVRQRERRR